MNEFKSLDVTNFYDGDMKGINQRKAFWASYKSPLKFKAPAPGDIKPYDATLLWRTMRSIEDVSYLHYYDRYTEVKELLRTHHLGRRAAMHMWNALLNMDRLNPDPAVRYNVREDKTSFMLLDHSDAETYFTVERCIEQLRMFSTKCWQSGWSYGLYAPFAGLLAIVFDSATAWSIFSQALPVDQRGSVLDWLPEDESEERLKQLVLDERKQPELLTSDYHAAMYWQSTLARFQDDELAAKLYDAHGIELTNQSVYQRGLFRDYLGSERWLELICHRYVEDVSAWVGDFVALEKYAELGEAADEMVDSFGDEYIKQLVHVHSHHISLIMLKNVNKKGVGRFAKTWLIEEGANAIYGLASMLSKGKSKRRTLAVEFLRRYRDMGAEELILTSIQGLDKKCQDAVQKEVLDHFSAEQQEVDAQDLPAWLVKLQADKKLARKKVPAFLLLETLPPLRVRATDEVLPEDIVELCVKALKESSLEQPHECIQEMVAWLDPRSAEKWSLAIYQSWIGDGAKSTHKWALFTLAWLGGDDVVPVLVKGITKWRGPRIQWAVDVLAEMANGLSVDAIAKFASQYTETARKRHCINALRRMARKKGLSLHVFEDSMVPECGFDARGKRDFQYSESRRFTLELDSELGPHFYDYQKESYIKSLPRKGKDDDPRQVELAKESYRHDKKLLAKVVKAQRSRFMARMINRSEWPEEHWVRYVLHHPLMTIFAQRLLWSGELEGASGDTTRGIFRVTEDLSLANMEDDEVKLVEGGRVCLMHPAQLTESERLQWAEVLADYEIVQPFDQLSHDVTEAKFMLAYVSEDGMTISKNAVTGSVPQYGLAENYSGEWSPVVSSDNILYGDDGYVMDVDTLIWHASGRTVIPVCHLNLVNQMSYDSARSVHSLEFKLCEIDEHEELLGSLRTWYLGFGQTIMNAPTVPVKDVDRGLLYESIASLNSLFNH